MGGRKRTGSRICLNDFMYDLAKKLNLTLDIKEKMVEYPDGYIQAVVIYNFYLLGNQLVIAIEELDFFESLSEFMKGDYDDPIDFIIEKYDFRGLIEKTFQV
jgi:hypothetical protein